MVKYKCSNLQSQRVLENKGLEEIEFSYQEIFRLEFDREKVVSVKSGKRQISHGVRVRK